MKDGEVQTAIGRSGKSYSFVWSDDPKSGTMKEVFFAPDKSYVIAFFINAPDPKTLEKIDTLVNVYRPSVFNAQGSASGAYWSRIFCWPYDIVSWQNRIGLVVPAYAKNFFFQSPPKKGKEKKSSWYMKPELKYHLSVPQLEVGDWRNMLTACLLLSRGIRKLHFMGLAHSDLSGNNVLVDAVTGATAIIDIDGLVVPDKFNAEVLGTPGYIAPEVLSSEGEKYTPSIDTDKHALSVLIYQLLLCRHPLEGKNRFGDEQTDKDMGTDAVFIENPIDKATRYDSRWVKKAYERQGPAKAKDLPYVFPWRDLDKLPYTSLGPYLSEVIERAFVKGLHNPAKRPSASDWEKALERTLELLHPCENPKCLAKWFIFQPGKPPICPFCGTRIRHSIPVLNCMRKNRSGVWEYEAVSISSLNGSTRNVRGQVVLSDRVKLYPSHAYDNLPSRECRTVKQLTPLAQILRNGDVWGIVNLASPNMILSKNGKSITVKKGEGKCLSSGLRIQLDGPNSRILEVEIMK